VSTGGQGGPKGAGNGSVAIRAVAASGRPLGAHPRPMDCSDSEDAETPFRWAGNMSHKCYDVAMARDLTQRELRNESGEIMRALDAGESFVVTRRGVAVGELTPIRRKRFVALDAVLKAFGTAAAVDGAAFRADLDRHVDQDPTPRG
jgi:antitoxin (DNA-binding transcriptional repressor) of toxin-antitoxin stability system